MKSTTGITWAACAAIASLASAQAGWPQYGRDSHHSAISPALAQPLNRIKWSTPVDLFPPGGGVLYIHYGSPLITPGNTVIVTLKIGPDDGFQIQAHKATGGALLWSMSTDYSLPWAGWYPSCGCALKPDGSVVVPAAGGTILVRPDADSVEPVPTRQAFFGMSNYNADPASYNQNIKICTPITTSLKGDLYFGFIAYGPTPINLQSGIARIPYAKGGADWISAAAASQDANIVQVVMNCAPALSNDGRTLYVACRNANSSGYLLGLDAVTLNQVSRIALVDPLTGGPASLFDEGTASPAVGPDGDVYYGVLENALGSNHVRGWMLHFNSTLTQTKIPGAFGWDDTISVVPAAAVPSYHGSSSYLVLTKYNNYVEGGGDGVNRVAVLDPNAAMQDPISGVQVMQEVITIAGPTHDNRFPELPNAVREWCINTAAVDVAGHCAMVNNEDGRLYRWDFNTNTLSQTAVLTAGIGEAYTPTVIGPDGTVYAINNAILFAVGQ